MTARQLSLTIVGLPLNEERLIRALLCVVNARTRDQWHFREELDADVALCDPQSALVALAQKRAERYGMPRCVSVVHEGFAPIAGTSVLTTPIRAADFIALLDTVSAVLAGTGHDPASIPRIEPVLPASTSQADNLGIALHTLLAQASDEMYRVESASAAFYVIPATRVMLQAQPFEEAEISAWLRAPQPLRLTPLPRQQARRLLADDEIKPQSLDWLLWRAGLENTQDRLLPELPFDARFALRRWPDFGRLKHEQSHFRMAALLTRAAHSIDELARASAQSPAAARAFVNACALCDLIEVRPHETRRAHAAQGGSFGRSETRYGGLFRSIRSALGFLHLTG